MGGIPPKPALWENPKVLIFPQIQTYIKSKLFWKLLDNRGLLQEKVWISFHKAQRSNYDKKVNHCYLALFYAIYFNFWREKVKTKSKLFYSKMPWIKVFWQKVWISQKFGFVGSVYNSPSYGAVGNTVCRMWESALCFSICCE